MRDASLDGVCLLPPLRCEDVELVAFLGVFVGAEDQRLSVRRKLGKAGEAADVGDLFQPGAVGVDQEQLELAAIALVLVAGEENLLSVRRERGREAGTAEIGDLVGVAAVGV